MLEAQQDQLEELGRDLLRPGEVRDTHRLIALAVREREESLDGVLGFLGQHVLGTTPGHMYPSRRSVSSPPPPSLSWARPDRSAMLANLPVLSSTMISSTFRASDSTALVHGQQPSER